MASACRVAAWVGVRVRVRVGQDACRVGSMLILLLELASRVQQLTQAREVVAVLLGPATAPRHLLRAALHGVDLLDTAGEVDGVAC